ncbi:MAG: RES family NAD+ phosphorylase [Erysipelotrichaceae bacterium]|nr:RES family NAD+ phosphorylase [Erysipelotrichaceae bacterium]
MNEEGLKVCNELADALNKKDKDRIFKAKYDFLYFGSSILDVVINYLVLCENKIDIEFGSKIIKKGSKLYRIRRFSDRTDFDDPNEWKYPPSMPENRANKEGEPALYLGTTENVCLLETHIKKDEKYVLGEYEVIEDIKVGGFLACEDINYVYSYLSGVILNAFLIAPSRNEKNTKIFEYLDNIYGDIQLSDLTIKIAKDIDLPLKFGVLNKKDLYYKTTNKLISKIKEKYPEGLSYSSCYIPMSTIYIECSDSNLVLYEAGMEKVKFVKSIIKNNTTKFTDLDFYKILIETKNKNFEKKDENI